MEIVVFGAGSLGSLVGGLLAREHDVTLVGRNPHVRAVSERGLELTGCVEATVRPEARLNPPASAELAIVTVKSFDTETAAAALSDRRLDVCLSLQNGMGNEAILAERLSAPVLAGTCTYGAVVPSPGTVRCTGVGRVALGARGGGSASAADRVGAAFRQAEIPTDVATDMPRRLWEKLAVNAGINPVTALSRIENGALLDGDAATIATAAARETATVANAEGVDLTAEDAEGALERVAEATAANTASMQQDVLEERKTEIDSINGHVVQRAAANDIDVPVNRTLLGLVRAWESGRGLQ
jgi:2-dehydropantoate 2-reductase